LRADVGIGPYNKIHLIDKLEFEVQCNVTERVWEVTTPAAPCTHCHRALPGKLKFETHK